MVMKMDAVNVINLQKATDALVFSARRYHEMLDEQLASSLEEFRKRQFPGGALKCVFLFYT